MNFTILQRTIAALLVSLVIVVALGFLAFNFVRDVIDASRLTAHSQQVLVSVERMRVAIVEVQLAGARLESAGDSASLVLFDHLQSKLNKNLRVLDSLVRDNGMQLGRVAQLRAIISTRSGPLVNAALAGPVIDEMQKIEIELKRERQAAITRQFYKFVTVSLVLLAVWIVNMLLLLLVLNRNLTARKKAESKLSLSASEIERLYEEAPCGYFTINEDGRIVKINRTLLRWTGYDKEGVSDRMHFLEMVSPDERDTLSKFLMADQSTSGVVEATLIRKNKEAFPAHINYTRIDGRNGQPLYLCSAIDNTERKKAEAEILRANKELEAFSYSVSHDLRAPLRSINGYGQILIEDYGDKIDPEGRRLITVIINNGKRMGQLIDDLLDFSRASRKEISRTSINMTEFVKQIADEMLEREPGRIVEMGISDLAMTNGDPTMLRQVWINLISNALKYSRKREKAAIEIGCYSSDGMDVFFIKDNGAGFNMDYYDKLFGVFQRLHKWQEFEGTGVGLALVKRIIERHGGKIWAVSKPDEGATFYYSIPAGVKENVTVEL